MLSHPTFGQYTSVNIAGTFIVRENLQLFQRGDPVLEQDERGGNGGAFAIGDWKWVRTAPVYLGVPILYSWVPHAAGSAWLQPLDAAVTAVILAAMIAWLLANPENVASRLLSQAALVRLGVLSYSVYLWQQLFLGPHTRWWSIPAIGIAAAVSYTLIEAPFLRLRRAAWPRPAGSASRQNARLAEPVPVEAA